MIKRAIDLGATGLDEMLENRSMKDDSLSDLIDVALILLNAGADPSFKMVERLINCNAIECTDVILSLWGSDFDMSEHHRV